MVRASALKCQSYDALVGAYFAVEVRLHVTKDFLARLANEYLCGQARRSVHGNRRRSESCRHLVHILPSRIHLTQEFRTCLVVIRITNPRVILLGRLLCPEKIKYIQKTENLRELLVALRFESRSRTDFPEFEHYRVDASTS